MSILVKGMDMPKDCAECYFLVERFTGNEFVNECDLQWHSGRCREEVDEECEMGVRSETCPLVEVPAPHGPLIDAAELSKWANVIPTTEDGGVDINDLEEYLDCAPVIIEAEEG